jgi:hypothetical protein
VRSASSRRRTSAGSFAAGTQQLAVLRFLVGGIAGDAAITYADTPVARELVNNATEPLLTEFLPGVVTAQLVPPVVTLQPVAQAVLQGTPVTFTVAASGSLPLAYQWQRNGVNLAGRTATALSLANVLVADAGAYSCRITNAAGMTNSAGAILTVLPPPADLIPTQVTVPALVVAGEPVTVTWTAVNLGTQTATAPWQDTVFVADNPAGQGLRALGAFMNFSSLATNQSLVRTGVVIVPADLGGMRYFGVLVDSNFQVPEANETNNTLLTAAATEVRVADLSLSGLSAPAAAEFGASIAVSWSVTNTGNATAAAGWSDRVYLATNSTALAGAITLATVAGAPLAPGTGYTRSLSVTLPSGSQWAAGSYFLVAVADHNGAQAEPDDVNNTASRPLEVTLPPLPDLAVATVLAPANTAPGVPFSLVWAATNRGSAAAAGLWSESVVWSNAASGLRELARFDLTNGLAAGAMFWRTQTITIPVNGPAGAVWLGAQADTLNEVAEENEVNNLALAVAPMTVPATLSLQLPFPQIAEDAANPVFTCLLVRNGSTASPLAVTLSSSDTNEITVPASVVIPAGQSSAGFPAQVRRDLLVDGPKLVTISAHAGGFVGASQALTVLDVDLPRLSLHPAADSVWEGALLNVTVSRALASTNPLTVVVESSNPGQLSPPTYITIPGGAAAANFAVLAVDDTLVEGLLECTLTATATGFEAATTSLGVLDNDLPAVAVTLASASVSEGAGPQATMGTVARSLLSSRALSVDLESTNTAAALVPARVVIPANQASVTFPVAAVNDDLVNPPKTTFIQPFVIVSGGNTRLLAGEGALLTATDNDGPTLRVVAASRVIAEGLNPANTVTIARNTPATNALAITLGSDRLAEATVPPSAVIPLNAASVVVPVTSIADGIPDGNQTVVITAAAPGFVSGSETITVTDADLPDLTAQEFTVPAVADTDTFVGVSYRVRNQGLGPVTTNFLVRVYLAKDPFGNDKVLATQANFNGTIPVGQFFEQALQIRTPFAAGDYWVVVELDAAGQVAEILEDNNLAISAVPIQVRAAYGAWVETTLTSALANTPVPMNGRATNHAGLGVASRLVNLHLQVRGTTRVISALTDSLGYFNLTWQPLPGEAGLYRIFATHPGVPSAPVQDEFRLVGMRADPPGAAFSVIEGQVRASSVVIENLSDLPLTGVAASVVSAPAGLQVDVGLSGNGVISGEGTAVLSYSVSPASAQASGQVILRVASAQGAVVDVALAVSVEALRPRLVARPGSLEAGMARGGQTSVEFLLVNEGGVASGPITVALPPAPWIALAMSNPLPSLPPGGSNVVTLLLTPAADLTLGAYAGSLALNGDNAYLALPFNFRALSEAKGDLRVTAVDELTYYAEGAPKLARANVVVRDAVTRTNVAVGLTDTNGQFFVPQLWEGYYELEVTADRHTVYQNTHLVVAGQTNELTTFLSRQVVTYNWTVEPVEIEDRYQITIDTTFEANVPAPVVTVDPPVIDLAQITAADMQIMVTITNHGLIAANAMRLVFPSHPLWEFQALLTDLGTLPARSGLTIPLLIRKVTPGGPAPKSGGDCHLMATVCWELICGPLTNTYCAGVALPNAQSGCVGGPGGPVFVTGGPGGGGGAVFFSPSYTGRLICDPECLLLAALGCIPGPIGCFFSGYSCGQGIQKNPNDPMSYVDCGMGFAGCLIPGAGLPACVYSITRCLTQFGSPPPPGAPPTAGTAKDFAGDALAPYRAGVRAMLDSFNDLTGSPDGVWINAQSGPQLGDWLARMATATQTNSDGGRAISIAESAALLTGTQPEGVPPAEVQRFLDRWNRTVINWSNGLLRPQDTPPGQSTDFADFPTYRDHVLAHVASQQTAEQNGYSDPVGAIVETVRFLADQGEGGGVCARVKLRTEQAAVLTRDAFRATLEIENQDSARLENVSVALMVTDADGMDRTGLFGIRPPELSSLTGVDGGGILAGFSTGRARWTIIPTSDAAPTNATQYFVSGRFSYQQSGAQLSVPLAPAAITVLPTPKLHVHYFHERDVFSDDPYTDPIEPAIPFNLALMIQNQGFGAARNFRITSAQPVILENDKGLLIDFQIIATEVAGQNMVPSLTANFGNINPGQTAIGRWLMTSTLQGLFIDYSATFQHLDALDGVELSLLEEVTIHEMIRLVQAGGVFEDGKPDFLVNDVPDLRDLPDMLYLSDGRTQSVAVVEVALHDGPPTSGRLEISLSAAVPGGWVYLRVPEPAGGSWRLTGIRRSDGVAIGVGTNAWITDRTFLGLGRRPTYEHILHLLDFDSTGLYTLTYEVLDATDHVAPVSQVSTLPPQSYARIPVGWSGEDEPGGSGIAGYDILVSENGGPFVRWLERTSLTGSLYFGTLGNSYAFYSVAVDRGGNREAAPGAPDATTIVTLTNRPPAFAPVADQAIDEGVEFVLAVPASDLDPADVLVHGLVDAPAGMTISPFTGLVRWATGEASGPSTNHIVVRAQDNGDPPLAATTAFTLVVREVNLPPTLAPIPNYTINEGQLLTFTNQTTDPDLPPNWLTFSLRAPVPAGAAVNPTNGIFTWRPNETQGPSTNHLAVMVSDNGLSGRSATQQFVVIVRDVLSDFRLSLGRTNVLSGERGALPLILRSSLDLTNLTLVVEVPAMRLADLNLRGLGSEVTGLSLVSTSANHSRLTFTLDPALATASVRDLAALDFLAVSNYHSAIVPLDAYSLLAWRASGVAVTNGTADDGRVIIVGREPVLESVLTPQPRLLLYGRPGAGYALEYRTNSAGSGAWTEWQRHTLAGRVAGFGEPPTPGIGSFWRAHEFRAEPPRLSLAGTLSAGFSLRLEGWPGTAYGLETTAALGLPWQSWTNFMLTDPMHSFHWINPGDTQRFFRGHAR